MPSFSEDTIRQSLAISFAFLKINYSDKTKSFSMSKWTGLMQGPMNIWTEHSNCHIHSRGDSKTLIALLIPNIFLIFLWNCFSMHIKAEGMTQFDIFHVLVENSVNSELCFFWSLLKPAKIWNLSKNAHVWAA